MPALPIAATISVPSGSGKSSDVQFHGWAGWVPALAQEIDTQRRIGQDASTAQGTGRMAGPVDVNAYRYETTKDRAMAFCALVESLPSPTPYQVTDPYGRKMWLRIHRAPCAPSRGRGPVDGTTQTTYQIAVTLTVERMPDV